MYFVNLKCFRCVCVCVCEREREREREIVGHFDSLFIIALEVLAFSF